MERGPDGKYPYKGPVDCALQTFRNEVRQGCYDCGLTVRSLLHSNSMSFSPAAVLLGVHWAPYAFGHGGRAPHCLSIEPADAHYW